MVQAGVCSLCTYREPVPDRPTLAYWLGREGFYTAMITSNSWFSSDWNTDYGYHYSEHPRTDSAYTIYTIGRDKLKEVKPDRWFLHIHFKEPHAPYNPPEEYIEELQHLPPIDYDISKKDGHDAAKAALNTVDEEERELLLDHFRIRYDGEMRYMDDQLDDVFSNLSLNSLLKDTLVVFWSDHGEQFWEHGDLTHAYMLHREENDGIFLFWAKNIIPDSWDGPTSLIDITPTILELYGIEQPPEVQGLPVGTAADDRPLYASAIARAGPVQSVMVDDKMLQYEWTTGYLTMYDKGVDPKQAESIFDRDDAESLELWDLLLPEIERMIPLVPEYTAQEPAMGW